MSTHFYAVMAESADAPALGAGGRYSRGGSSPLGRIRLKLVISNDYYRC